MQPVCDANPNVGQISNGFLQIQQFPEVLAEPLVVGDSPVDGFGCSIYGSVIRDGGTFRMWYQAWSDDWNLTDSCRVACVESADGLVWTKPNYNLVEYKGSRSNHLTNLPFHCPSVFIDPTASSESRYRAFGYVNINTMPECYREHQPAESGYYTACSADGIHWKLGSRHALWPYGDVITSCWDPYLQRAKVYLKRTVNCAGLGRRSVFQATFENAEASAEVQALVPDEYDDICAHARGFQSGDYYGMGSMPCGSVTVGFLWNFRHMSPITWGYGGMGRVDLSLVVQGGEGAQWRHIYGRPDWHCSQNGPLWARGAVYTSSSPIHVDDQSWLYFSGTKDRHGYTGVDRDYREFMDESVGNGGFCKIGLMKWSKDRLLGYSTSLRDRIELRPDCRHFNGSVSINARTRPGGSIVARVLDQDAAVIEGYDFTDSNPVSGDFMRQKLTWNNRPELPQIASGIIVVELQVEDGDIFAFDFDRED